MPAFAVFYNGYFQERSKMNMQMMDLMLKQASPQYLTSMIEKTQSNIAELQKTRDKIISSDQKNKSQLALKQAEMEFAATKINAKVSKDDLEFTKKIIAGGNKATVDRNAEKDIADFNKEDKEIETAILNIEGQLLDDTKFKDYNAYISKNKLEATEQKKVALTLEALENKKDEIAEVRGDDYVINLRNQLQTFLGTSSPQDILANEYLYARGSLKPSTADTTSSETPKEKRFEELGFVLSPEEMNFADKFITKQKGNLQTSDAITQTPVPGIGSTKYKYSDLTKEQKDIVQKRLKQRLLQEKKGYVSAPKIKGGDSDLQERLDAIDKQLTKESEKLQGYFTRYDVGQQDVLDKVFSPFDTNYRTQNLFVRKSPEVLKQEKEIRDMQYAERKDTPSAYANLQYNTEYQAPGGLNFGITKLGEEEIPYIFEKGTPYEISEGDPSYSFILELLAEQDKQLGGLK